MSYNKSLQLTAQSAAALRPATELRRYMTKPTGRGLMFKNEFWFYENLFLLLDSKYTPMALVLFCGASFVIGQWTETMALFASSGAIMSIFGLISLIKYPTFKKLLNREAIAESQTGVTGPPLSEEESRELKAKNVEKAKMRIRIELRTELKGFSMSVAGTLVAAYGGYIPIL